ncbi:MAG: hydantoinase/oxoprolinase family protein, partial [Sphingomonas sp.]
MIGKARWRVAIDRGGTFTDVVARTPDGALVTAKLLSDDPEHYQDAAVEAIRRLTGVRDGPLPAMDIRIGTTIATNALLERRGEPTVLAITRGFGDALTIGYQDRPDIFAREIVRAAPLAARVLEIDERLSAEGDVLRPLDLAAAERDMRAAVADGLCSIAIVLVHGWRHTAHEAALAALATKIGFTQVSVSHRVAPLIRLVARSDTTLVDAYLSPALGRYTATLRTALGAAPAPLFMQSSGGLVTAEAFHGKDALLSGPAGGIVGMVASARAAGFDRVIGFDMGGTSTDVSLYSGVYERRDETLIGGVRVAAPMLRIDTVAAGGGSVCRFDGGRFVVGPESAGAMPGPACYGRGGPLTLTDCNVVLGKIRADIFPAVFGDSGDKALDRGAALAQLDALIAEVDGATGTRPSREETAEGMVAIGVANMAQAIRAVSVARGADPADYVLACFGGAAGQHACLVADALGIERVLLHPLAGVLSAYGIALADQRVARMATIGLALQDETRIAAAFDDLAADARAALAAQGVAAAYITIEATAQLRYARSDQGLDVPYGTVPGMRAAFEAAYRQRFGFVGDDALVVERLRVEAVTKETHERAPPLSPPLTAAVPAHEVEVHMAGVTQVALLHRRADLACGLTVNG